jgi:hypothetical protein
MDDFKVSFSALNEYCVDEVFKYLIFCERLRFMRVNKYFGSVLESIWQRQKCFFLTYGDMSSYVYKCGEKKHVECCTDRLSIRGTYCVSEKMFQASIQIVSKCPSLLLFHWAGDKCHQDVGIAVAKHCKNLQHVSFDLTNCFGEFIKGYKWHVGKKIKWRCLDLNDTEEMPGNVPIGKTLSMAKFLFKCKEIVNLSNMTEHNSVVWLKMLAPQLKTIRVASFECLKTTCFDLFKFGKNMSHLSILENVPKRQMCTLVSQLSNLTSLELGSNPQDIGCIEKLLNLKELSWIMDPVINHAYNYQAALERVMQSRGGSLRVLKLTSLPNVGVYLNTISIYCHQLVSLTLSCVAPRSLENGDIYCLGFLKNLRVLSLSHTLTSGATLGLLLSECCKLRMIYLPNYIIGDDGLELIKIFSGHHPKRTITLHLNCDLLPDKKDITDSLRIYGNLRLLYDLDETNT